MPVVVIAGLIVGAGLMARSARTFPGLIGAISQEQSRGAREIAESVMAIILKELNRNYPYLLIEGCTATSNSGAPDYPRRKSRPPRKLRISHLHCLN